MNLNDPVFLGMLGLLVFFFFFIFLFIRRTLTGFREGFDRAQK